MIFGCKRVNCDEIDKDKLRLPANRNCHKLSRVSWPLARISCYYCYHIIMRKNVPYTTMCTKQNIVSCKVPGRWFVRRQVMTWTVAGRSASDRVQCRAVAVPRRSALLSSWRGSRSERQWSARQTAKTDCSRSQHARLPRASHASEDISLYEHNINTVNKYNRTITEMYKAFVLALGLELLALFLIIDVSMAWLQSWLFCALFVNFYREQ